MSVTDSPKVGSGVDPTPLSIAIVGAGISGLTAAIGLRRNDHQVTLYEQSRFANETGAAMHLAPNANGILRRYGLFAEDFGGVTLNGAVNYNEKGVCKQKLDLKESNKEREHPWHLIHRVKLHEALRDVATSAEGTGPAARLFTSNKVVEVIPESGVLILENGNREAADVVLGADGIHSKTRAAVSRYPPELFSSGQAAFRFLITRETALEDPEVAKLCEKEDEMSVWSAADRRVVMYPCNDNKILNIVGIHPENESHGTADEWNTSATVEQMLEVYSNFYPTVLSLLRLANPTTLKVWKLLDMEVIPSWTKGRLALLGDAAHPFLPHQGQGGCMAIEDSASLAVVLPNGTRLEDIPERLKLYQEIRYERVNRIQQASREAAGKDPAESKPRVLSLDRAAYYHHHDEWENSTNVFREWQLTRNAKA